MTSCFFVTDLHGQIDRYQKLFECIIKERPSAVFLGGDLLPHGMALWPEAQFDHDNFIKDFMIRHLEKIQDKLAGSYPDIFIILGNDDGRIEESTIIDAADKGMWHYMHEQKTYLGDYPVYGYACIPPSPFLLKDWERYDVSRHVDPGSLPPGEGWRTVPVEKQEIRYGTIARDLEKMTGQDPMEHSIFLFHSPPYKTKLDRAALDGILVEHVPLDVNIGSIAIKRFIEKRQPHITLHGHVHESARLTGSWQDRIGKTWCFSAAHDGPELALIRFDPEEPEKGTRALI